MRQLVIDNRLTFGHALTFWRAASHRLLSAQNRGIGIASLLLLHMRYFRYFDCRWWLRYFRRWWGMPLSAHAVNFVTQWRSSLTKNAQHLLMAFIRLFSANFRLFAFRHWSEKILRRGAVIGIYAPGMRRRMPHAHFSATVTRLPVIFASIEEGHFSRAACDIWRPWLKSACRHRAFSPKMGASTVPADYFTLEDMTPASRMMATAWAA